MAAKPVTPSLTVGQQDGIHAALLGASRRATTRFAPKLRRVANESRLFNRFIANKTADALKANPKATPADIFKFIMDFINNGGLDNLLAAILKIIAIFSA